MTNWSKMNHRCAHRWDYTAAAVPSALTADMEADQERRAIDKKEKEKARRKEQDRRKKEAEKKRNEMEESAAAAKQVGSSYLLGNVQATTHLTDFVVWSQRHLRAITSIASVVRQAEAQVKN